MFKFPKGDVDPNNNLRTVSYAFRKDFPKITRHPFLHNKAIRLNDDGYRSDDFLKEHDGLHILFSGCSNTYGDGLEEHEIWAKQLYDRIKKDTKVSGFFNIGTPGQGITYIIFHIFKYIETYGKPDAIFINFPVSRRFVSFDKKSDKYVYFNVYEPEDATYELWQTIPLLEYQYLFMLEKYCKSNHIVLTYGTWDKKSHFDMYEDLEYYIDIYDDIKIAEYAQNHPEDKFTLTARDGVHYGTAFHTVWADSMYNSYMKRIKNDG